MNRLLSKFLKKERQRSLLKGIMSPLTLDRVLCLGTSLVNWKDWANIFKLFDSEKYPLKSLQSAKLARKFQCFSQECCLLYWDLMVFVYTLSQRDVILIFCVGCHCWQHSDTAALVLSIVFLLNSAFCGTIRIFEAHESFYLHCGGSRGLTCHNRVIFKTRKSWVVDVVAVEGGESLNLKKWEQKHGRKQDKEYG